MIPIFTAISGLEKRPKNRYHRTWHTTRGLLDAKNRHMYILVIAAAIRVLLVVHTVHFCVFFPHPSYYVIIFAFLFSLPPTVGVARIRGHTAGSSTPSPVRFVPTIYIARSFALLFPPSSYVCNYVWITPELRLKNVWKTSELRLKNVWIMSEIRLPKLLIVFFELCLNYVWITSELCLNYVYPSY